MGMLKCRIFIWELYIAIALLSNGGNLSKRSDVRWHLLFCNMAINKYRTDAFNSNYCLKRMSNISYGTPPSILTTVNILYYTPGFYEFERGVYWFHLVRLSVRPSVCPSVRLWTYSCPLCIFNNTRQCISYLHIFSSNVRRCVPCNVCFKI